MIFKPNLESQKESEWHGVGSGEYAGWGMVRIWFFTKGATLQGRCDKTHFAHKPPRQIFFQNALNWSMWNSNIICYLFNHHTGIQHHDCANFWPLFIDDDDDDDDDDDNNNVYWLQVGRHPVAVNRHPVADGDSLPVHSLSSSDPWPFLNWCTGHTQKNFHELHLHNPQWSLHKFLLLISLVCKRTWCLPAAQTQIFQ